MGSVCQAAGGLTPAWRKVKDPTTVGVLCSNLRQSDEEERAFMARTFPAQPLEAQLLGACRRGLAWELREGHWLLGIGGVWPFPQSPDVASIYFIGTPKADEKKVFLYRECRNFISYQAQRYAKLGNLVPSHMTDRIQWLTSLGFDMDTENKHFLDKGCQPFWLTSRPEH